MLESHLIDRFGMRGAMVALPVGNSRLQAGFIIAMMFFDF